MPLSLEQKIFHTRNMEANFSSAKWAPIYLLNYSVVVILPTTIKTVVAHLTTTIQNVVANLPTTTQSVIANIPTTIQSAVVNLPTLIQCRSQHTYFNTVS